MNNDRKILARADGDFPFHFFIEKAVLPVEPENSYEIVGVASTPNIDHDMERMALPALKRMAEKINFDGVPLRVEHQKNDNAIIGKVSEAWVDESNKMWIKAKLTKGNIAAEMLHNALVGGAKLGLSVGGRVKQAVREMSEHQGKMIKTFFDVILDEVSVTPRPSNYDSWLLNKHITNEGDNSDALYNTPIHDTFLRENPKFDYLVAIEKSIPDKAWKKVEESNLNLKIEHMEKYVTKSEFENFKNEFFTELRKFTESDAVGVTREMDAPAASDVDAHDQNNPTDEKETPEAQERTVKQRAEKTGANGSDEQGQREKNPGEDAIGEDEQTAHDQDNDTETKDENPAQTRTVKSIVSAIAAAIRKGSTKPPFPVATKETTDEEETATEKEMSETSSTKEKEMSETSSTKEKEISESSEDEKEMSEFSETKKGLRKTTSSTADREMSETSSTREKDQSESESTEEEYDASDYEIPEAKKSVSSLDAFSVAVGQLIDGAESRMEKSGRRIPGLRQLILDFVRNDSDIQKDIKAMMREPGMKKSIVGNEPVVFLKDGTRLKLVPTENYLQKNIQVNKNAKFGDVYKNNYSSANDTHIGGVR